MSLQPPALRTKSIHGVWCAFLVTMCGAVALPGADVVPPASPANNDGAIPQSTREEDFEALLSNSPFTRSLGISESLILTGIAHVENDVLATLLDTKTMESHVVSKTANFQGWQLVGVGGNAAEARTWMARIQIAGGEIISIRYQPPPKKIPRASSGSNGKGPGGPSGNAPPLNSSQLAEAKQAAVNYREGFSSDGYPQKPPPEMVAKLSRLSVSQRETINQQMLGLRNQGLGLSERRKIYEGLVDKAR